MGTLKFQAVTIVSFFIFTLLLLSLLTQPPLQRQSLLKANQCENETASALSVINCLLKKRSFFLHSKAASESAKKKATNVNRFSSF